MLQSLTDLYVLLSTDAIYDVSRDKSHEHHLMEHDAVRPDEVTERDQRRFYYLKGHNRKVRSRNVSVLFIWPHLRWASLQGLTAQCD